MMNDGYVHCASAQGAALLDRVIGVIRRTIDEDWIDQYAIDEATRFGEDLELESIEFITIAAAFDQEFGGQVQFIAWLSAQSFDALISLTVGDVSAHIAQALAQHESR